MAGGIGSRFWPMSRTALPKQFHDIAGTGLSLLQQTYNRFLAVALPEHILVVTNVRYVNLVAEQLPDLPSRNILTEPISRNTAPCIAYAAFRVQLEEPDADLIITPSDHLIKDEELFLSDIRTALRAANTERAICTLGITPTRPDTGYGYIQYHREPDGSQQPDYFKVKTFTEKPGLEMARTFVHSGDFLWNSGIFISPLSVMLSAFQQHLPETFDAFEAERDRLGTPSELEMLAELFERLKPVSIDYGVMEKTKPVLVVRSNFRWSDLGTWTALYDELPKDDAGNAAIGNVRFYSAANNIVQAQPHKLVVLKGVDDLIVVETEEAILICPKSSEQEIREIVTDLKRADSPYV
jgi:mannose-1-phosphate guanylyltransferase